MFVITVDLCIVAIVVVVVVVIVVVVVVAVVVVAVVVCCTSFWSLLPTVTVSIDILMSLTMLLLYAVICYWLSCVAC